MTKPRHIRSVRVYLGTELATLVRHEFDYEGRHVMEFSYVEPEVAMKFPPARPFCQQQADYGRAYRRRIARTEPPLILKVSPSRHATGVEWTDYPHRRGMKDKH